MSQNLQLSAEDISSLRQPPSKFQPKTWLANCWQRSQQQQAIAASATSSSDAAASQLSLALQLQAQECSSVLDDLANQLLSRAPRSMVEIDRCDTELASLRAMLQAHGAAQSRSAAVQGEVEAATEKIRTMQVARQRLHHCKDVLAEAHQLSQRCDATEKRVQTLCGGGSPVLNSSSVTFSAVADDIAGLRRSIAMIQSVEPTVIKPVANRVMQIESQFQQFAERDVLSTLVKAAQMGASAATAAAAASSSNTDEALAALARIGRIPDLVARALASLHETRKTKLLQELKSSVTTIASSNTASTPGASASPASPLVSTTNLHTFRKVFHSLAKYMEHDFDHLLALLEKHFTNSASSSSALPSSSSSSNKDSNSSHATNINNSHSEARVAILTAVIQAGLNIASALEQPATKIVHDSVAIDAALTVGAKVVSEFDGVESRFEGDAVSPSSVSAWTKLMDSVRAPYKDAAAQLEKHEQTVLTEVLGKCAKQSNSSEQHPQQDAAGVGSVLNSGFILSFSLLSDAIVASSHRCCKDWRTLVPDAGKRAMPLWTQNLKTWAREAVNRAVPVSGSNNKSSNNVSASSSSSTSSSMQQQQKYRATLRALLEICDAAKPLAERCAQLESQLQHHQHAQADAEHLSSQLKPGVAAICEVHKRLENVFLQHLMSPAVVLCHDFAACYASKKKPAAGGQATDATQNAEDDDNVDNNNNSGGGGMPSEQVRLIGSWCMELPMQLEAVGADAARWSAVAAENLLACFCHTMWPTEKGQLTKQHIAGLSPRQQQQQKVDLEFLESVLSAVDDQLNFAPLHVAE